MLNILVGKSNHSPAKLFKTFLAAFTLRPNFIVIASVDFDDQHFLRAREVDDPMGNWVLATKLQATNLPRSQDGPQEAFTASLIFPQ